MSPRESHFRRPPILFGRYWKGRGLRFLRPARRTSCDASPDSARCLIRQPCDYSGHDLKFKDRQSALKRVHMFCLAVSGSERATAKACQLLSRSKIDGLLQSTYRFEFTRVGAALRPYLICAPVLLAGEEVDVESLQSKICRTSLSVAKQGDIIPHSLPQFKDTYPFLNAFNKQGSLLMDIVWRGVQSCRGRSLPIVFRDLFGTIQFTR